MCETRREVSFASPRGASGLCLSVTRDRRCKHQIRRSPEEIVVQFRHAPRGFVENRRRSGRMRALISSHNQRVVGALNRQDRERERERKREREGERNASNALDLWTESWFTRAQLSRRSRDGAFTTIVVLKFTPRMTRGAYWLCPRECV